MKFKADNHVLTDEQNRWIEKTETKIYELMGETPPLGKQFGESVKHILEREVQWNIWKNQGCPSLKPKYGEETNNKVNIESIHPFISSEGRYKSITWL